MVKRPSCRLNRTHSERALREALSRINISCTAEKSMPASLVFFFVLFLSSSIMEEVVTTVVVFKRVNLNLLRLGDIIFGNFHLKYFCCIHPFAAIQWGSAATLLCEGESLGCVTHWWRYIELCSEDTLAEFPWIVHIYSPKPKLPLLYQKTSTVLSTPFSQRILRILSWILFPHLHK